MRSLFKRDFTLVVIGQIISLFGSAILRFALPLYLLRVTDSASLFGLVTACSFVPLVVFSLAGGVIADRKNKRDMMVALDLTTAALVLGCCLALQALPLVPLLLVVLMLLYGIAGLYQPAVQASIPLLVPPQLLMQGNAVINTVSTLAGLVGPLLGGVLFGAFGIRPILWLGSGCFALSAIMEVFIRIPYQKSGDGKGVFSALGQDVADSWRFVKNERPVFLAALGVLALFNLVLSAVLVVGIPVAIVQVLALPDAALGVTQGAVGLGGLLGGVVAGVAAPKMRLKNGYLLLLGCSLAAVVMGAAILPGLSPNAAHALLTAASLGAMCVSTLFSVTLLTAIQRQTPPRLLGKVMAVTMAVSGCAQPVGQAVYGVLFEVCAACPAAVLFGAAALAVAVSLCSQKVFAALAQERTPAA